MPGFSSFGSLFRSIFCLGFLGLTLSGTSLLADDISIDSILSDRPSTRDVQETSSETVPITPRPVRPLQSYQESGVDDTSVDFESLVPEEALDPADESDLVWGGSDADRAARLAPGIDQSIMIPIMIGIGALIIAMLVASVLLIRANRETT